MLNNLGFGSPWFFISIILESCGSFCCASIKLIVGLTDIAQDSPSGIVAFALRLGINVDGGCRKESSG